MFADCRLRHANPFTDSIVTNSISSFDYHNSSHFTPSANSTSTSTTHHHQLHHTILTFRSLTHRFHLLTFPILLTLQSHLQRQFLVIQISAHHHSLHHQTTHHTIQASTHLIQTSHHGHPPHHRQFHRCHQPSFQQPHRQINTLLTTF